MSKNEKISYPHKKSREKMLFYNVFVVEKSASFVTPGHEEIELALVKLYDCTGNEKYLRMRKEDNSDPIVRNNKE